MFDELCDLPRGATPAAGSTDNCGPVRTSLVDFLNGGGDSADVFATSGGSLRHRYTAGHAWAARRELLDPLGFYDVRILGSGNKVMASAAYGKMADSVQAYQFNQPEAEHYLAWATRCYDAVRGRVGSVEGRV